MVINNVDCPLKFFKTTMLNGFFPGYEIFNAAGYHLGFFSVKEGVWTLERRSCALTLCQIEEIVDAMTKAKDGREAEISSISNEEYQGLLKLQDEIKHKEAM